MNTNIYVTIVTIFKIDVVVICIAIYTSEFSKLGRVNGLSSAASLDSAAGSTSRVLCLPTLNPCSSTLSLGDIRHFE